MEDMYKVETHVPKPLMCFLQRATHSKWNWDVVKKHTESSCDKAQTLRGQNLGYSPRVWTKIHL